MTQFIFRLTRALFTLVLALAAAAARPDRAAAQGTDTVAVAVAQDSIFEFRLTDGSVLYGRIIEDRGERVVVQTQGGATITLDRSQIVSMLVVRGRMVNGQVWPEDPHATRLFFGPTARAIEQGEGYFGVYELFFPFVSYGLTDRFTISAGTPIVPEAIGQIFYLAPKYEVIRTGNTSAAVGVLALFATSALEGGSAGLLYGVGTFGAPDGALTVGATVPFVTGGGGEIGSDPAFMLGGEARLTRRTKFISENYLFPKSGALVSGGIRFFGERLSADFGVGAAFGGEGENFCCIPLVNFIYSF
jgi:hypothetical protein